MSGRRIALLGLIGLVPILIALWIAGFDVYQQLGRYVVAEGVVAGEEVIASAPADGQVSDVRVEPGQRVQSGQSLFRLIGPAGAPVDVVAPREGTAIQISAVVGQRVSTGDRLALLDVAPKLRVVAYVPEKDVAAVRAGQRAEVTIPALGATYQGTIGQVLPAGATVEVSGGAAPTKTGTTYPVTVDFDYGAAPLKLAMAATVRIYR